jgi:hypothetical protein
VHAVVRRSTAAPGEVTAGKAADAARWFMALSNAVVVSEAAEALAPKGQFILR